MKSVTRSRRPARRMRSSRSSGSAICCLAATKRGVSARGRSVGRLSSDVTSPICAPRGRERLEVDHRDVHRTRGLDDLPRFAVDRAEGRAERFMPSDNRVERLCERRYGKRSLEPDDFGIRVDWTLGLELLEQPEAL